jgi:hypothetical protein
MNFLLLLRFTADVPTRFFSEDILFHLRLIAAEADKKTRHGFVTGRLIIFCTSGYSIASLALFVKGASRGREPRLAYACALFARRKKRMGKGNGKRSDMSDLGIRESEEAQSSADERWGFL